MPKSAALDRFIASARLQVGTPFVHQGRVPGVGLDCVGLTVHAASRAGFALVDQTGYGRSPANGMLEMALDYQDSLERVYGELEPGDILLMRFHREPQHLAIYTERDTIIHGYEGVTIVCEHRMSSDWVKRIVRVYRFKEQSDV